MLPLEWFFPVPWEKWKLLFEPASCDLDLDAVVVLHYYGALSAARTVEMDISWLQRNPCAFSELARRAFGAPRRLQPRAHDMGEGADRGLDDEVVPMGFEPNVGHRPAIVERAPERGQPRAEGPHWADS